MDMEKVLSERFEKYLFELKEMSYLEGMDSVRKTKTYRLGKTLLKPLDFFKK